MFAFFQSFADLLSNIPLADAITQGTESVHNVVAESEEWHGHWIFGVCSFLGTVVGAIGGAMASSRVRMDMFGIICCGTLAALGGGTLRDILLQGIITPTGEECKIYWVTEGGVIYLYYAVFTSALVFYITKFYTPPAGTLRILDAFGMAFFTLFGASKAHIMDCPAIVTIGMGICTGVAGGALRDLVTGNVPYVFRPGELYATAAFIGASAYLVFLWMDFTNVLAYMLAVAVCFFTRMGAVYLNWQLPSFRPIYENHSSLTPKDEIEDAVEEAIDEHEHKNLHQNIH